MNIELKLGDCLEVLKTIPDNSIDSVVTDPPYGIGFMNKEWDNPTKHRELIEREQKRSEERFAEGKSPAKGGFSRGVQPGLPIGGAKEGKWFQEWCELWAAECLRILKPGGHILSFSAPRTYHRMATAFEDAGFQIRDQLMWVFGSGFPKSHNISIAIDKQKGLQGDRSKRFNAAGTGTSNGGSEYRSDNPEFKKYETKSSDAQEWEGWGTALKPAHEPIVMARKPLSEKSIAENVLKHGTGGINIDGSRIGTTDNLNGGGYGGNNVGVATYALSDGRKTLPTNKLGKDDFIQPEGRFPANIIFDEEAGQLLDEQTGELKQGYAKPHSNKKSGTFNKSTSNELNGGGYNDKGGASRFFYCPKASKKDRNEGLEHFEEKVIEGRDKGQDERNVAYKSRTTPRANVHPTVKPTDLMRYLINLVTPPNGTVLDPFMGSGSTGKAAVRAKFNFIGIEKEQEYMDIAKARIEHEKNKPIQKELFD